MQPLLYASRVAGPSRKLEEKLAALKAMERGDAAPDVAALREALGGKTGLLVAATARLVGSRELRELVPDLAAAFSRLCERPVERDPGCRGKVAVARALRDLDAWEDDVFVRGIALVQQEPVWGGREDTAAELRAECAMAFAHAGRDDALDVLADLLADPHRAARAAAAQALGDTGRPDAAALLRYKVLVGDPEPEVLSSCLGSILALAPRTALSFFERLLREGGETADAAALVLGESRLSGARPLLLAFCEEAPPDARSRVGYLALALLREEAANEWLLGRVREADPGDAIAAGKALATFRDDPRLAEKLREAAAGQGRAVVAAVEEALAARPR